MKPEHTKGMAFPKAGSDTITAKEFRNMHDTEDELQHTIDEFLKFYPDVRVIRVPDKFWRSLNYIKTNLDKIPQPFRSVLKNIIIVIQSAFSGMPDLVLIRKQCKYNTCLMIELKVRGRKPRQNQRKWIDQLNVPVDELFEVFKERFDGWYDDDRMHKINNWINAYPLEIFPEPDLKKAARVLSENGMTLDAISASGMRHVLKGIKEIIDE